MRRRLARIYGNETAFTVGVICLGLFSIAMMLAVLLVK